MIACGRVAPKKGFSIRVYDLSGYCNEMRDQTFPWSNRYWTINLKQMKTGETDKLLELNIY